MALAYHGSCLHELMHESKAMKGRRGFSTIVIPDQLKLPYAAEVIGHIPMKDCIDPDDDMHSSAKELTRGFF